MTEPEGKVPPRRRFFREALNHLFESVDEVLQQRGLDSILGADETVRRPSPPNRATPRHRLRPPGALPEDEFVHRCHRGGECVSACPVGAIQVTHSDDPAEDQTPYIAPALGACVVCDELACTKACPSGALTAITDRSEIRMGTAKVEQATCVRAWGDPCRECLDRCPFGDLALGLDAEGRLDVRAGCVGCGVCEFYCPTTPRSIYVVPPASSSRASDDPEPQES